MSASTLDSVCALCGGDEQRLRFREGPFSIVACASCDLTYVTPRFADEQLLDSVYDELYWTSPVARERGYTDYAADADLYRRTFARRMDALAEHLPDVESGRVLDVGCAAGYFLAVMRERGWDVHGVEPSTPIRRVAVEALGADRIHAGPLAAGDHPALQPGSFDLVTLWDVVEHLPDPVATLRTAASLLRPGGRLLVETQNVASLFARVLGRRWQHYKHAEHLWHFNRATLGQALDQAGLRVELMTPRHAGKYVRPAFIRERAARLGPLGRLLAAPLKLAGERPLYVNPRDELIAIASPA